MAKKQNFFSVFLNGLIFENPTFSLMLGMCPTLGITTAASNGIGMGLATTFVLVRSGLNIVVIALFWLVPVGMPVQGIVRLFSDAASHADDSLALISFVLLAALLVLRTILFWKRTKTA